jgi:putative spermidine/putrescine transport system permease protein
VNTKTNQIDARPIWSRIDTSWWLVLPIVLAIGGFYVLPLLSVFTLSVTEPQLGLGNYEKLLTSRSTARVFLTTIRVCAATTAITIVLGFIVAWAMTRVKGLHQRLLIIGVIIPLWISVIVRGLSWLVILRDNGLINDWLIASNLIDTPLRFVNAELGVVIGMVHYSLPYAILPMFAVMRGIDQKLLLASQSLGASASTTFFKVFFPLALPGVLAATLLVFVFGLGFYVTPSLLGGGRVVMLAESVSVYVLSTARWGMGSAQALLLFVLAITLIGILSKTVGLRKGLG